MAGSFDEAGRASFLRAPTRRVRVAGEDVVHRDLGTASGGAPPLVALTRLGANLDSWDPEVVDPLAEDRRVLVIGYRGVGGSTGAVRRTFDEAAADVIAILDALGLERVDLFGQSTGGMVAQAVLERAPERIDRQSAPGGVLPHAALILHGDTDRLVPPENIEPLRRRFDDALVIVFSDSGHGAVPQNRHAVLDAVRTFLRR